MGARKWAVISPHCDDGALSIGVVALMRRPGMLITVLDGIPPDRVQGEWDTITTGRDSRDLVRQRRAEDAAVAEALQIPLVGLGFLDLQYRSEPLNETEVAGAIAAAIAPDITDVFVPAGLGRPPHPDHVQVRDAALQALLPLPVQVWLHADIPYAFIDGVWPDWVHDTTESTPSTGPYEVAVDPAWALGRAERLGLMPTEVRRKTEILRLYESQFDALDGPERLLTRPGNLEYEVVWHLTRAHHEGHS